MSNYAKRSRRIFAGVLAGALALSVTPILGLTGVASAQEVADPTGAGNFCENVPQQEPFTDVQTTDPAFGEIVCLVATEITTGVTATTYEPNSFVTRRQMALFLVRLANEANRLEVGDSINELPAPADTDFTDTEDEEQFIEDAISQITQAEIAQGFPDNSYRPAAPVSRRQMAAFIDRTYEFLTGTALPRSTTDHFADDNSDSAEAQSSTNAVAEAGIFIGNADGTFAPAKEITRRQMASVLTRTLQVLFENGEITAWVDADATNQTFALAQDTTTQEVNTTRTCTVTGITPNTVVDVALVNSADITVTNGTVSFADVGNNGEADLNPVAGAVIANVNGANVTPSPQVNDVVAAIGAISVTFTSASPAGGDVTLVVWADPRTTDFPAGNNELNLNAQDQPTEAFGVGCRTVFLPVEAGVGTLGTDEPVVSLDKTADRISTDAATYFYDANDTFFVRTTDSDDLTGTACVAGEQVTLAQFEAALSRGDELDGSTFYQPNADLPSSFCLEDIAPPAPTVTVTTVTSTAINGAVTGVVPGASVRIYLSNDDADAGDTDGANFPTNFSVVLTEANDLDAATAGIQFSIPITAATGSPDGPGNCGVGERDFTVAATQIVDGDESAPDFEIDNCVPDTAESVAPTITDTWVSNDGPVVGLLIEAAGTSGDTVDFAFSEDMSDALGTTAATFFRISDGTNTFQVDCAAGCTLDDLETKAGTNANAISDDHLQVNLTAATITRIAGAGPLDLASGTITVTLVSGAWDDQAGNQLNLAGSADVVVDIEP